jgi:hypothetical protein
MLARPARPARSGTKRTAAIALASLVALLPTLAAMTPAGPAAPAGASGKSQQTITFVEPAAPTYGDDPVTLDVTTSATGLVPTLATTDTAVCNVSGFTVTFVAAGKCTITATQSGDDDYAPADPVTRTITIAQRVLSLSGTRVYDATTSVAADVLTISGLFGSEELVLGGSAALPSSDAGVTRPLTVTGITLGDGANNGSEANYTLSGGVHTVTIDPRPVRGGFTVNDRTFDTTTTVDETLITSRTLTNVPGAGASGVVPGDDVALVGGTATFSSAEPGERTVTLAGATLTGTRASNYVLESVATTTATITPGPLVPDTDLEAAEVGATVSCTPAAGAITVGTEVTCTVTGGDPGSEILWRAAINPVIAEAGVTLDADGTGTFAFTVPSSALGAALTVELVAWTAPVALGVVDAGGLVPTRVPAGEGPRPGGEALALVGLLAVLLVVLLAVVGMLGASRMRRAGIAG